jgi:hypothetical protein
MYVKKKNQTIIGISYFIHSVGLLSEVHVGCTDILKTGFYCIEY